MSSYKVTLEMVEEEVVQTEYVILPDGKTTICLLTMRNGYTIRGESSCVDPANFKKEDGEKYALERAMDKIWPLLGFRMQDKMHRETGTTFLERLELERDELAYRYLKLGQFLESGDTNKLSDADLEDLHDQHRGMHQYFEALDRRVTRLSA